MWLKLNNEKIISILKEKSIDLNFEQLDSLMELGNIGSGNAVTALSQLLNRKIEMSLTKVSIIPFWKIMDLLEDPQTVVFGIHSDIRGHANLSIFQFFTKKSVMNMIAKLSDYNSKKEENINKIQDIDEFSLSIISEIGNILTGHYTSALANLMTTQLIPKVPVIALDTLETITNSLIANYSERIDHFVIIKTNIKIEELELIGTFCFIPDVDTLEKIFQAINTSTKRH